MDRKKQAATCRVSVSFPTMLYEDLEKIAENKKVSIAWVVRDAAEQYLANKYPLIEGAHHKENN